MQHRRYPIRTVLALASFALVLVVAPAAGATRADQLREDTRRADRAMRTLARDVSGYHERRRPCYRTRRSGRRVTVCRYFFSHWDAQGRLSACPGTRVIVRGSEPEIRVGACADWTESAP